MSNDPAPSNGLQTEARNDALILLCTYNEVGNLPDLLESLSQHIPCADTLVVDDNSPDGTGRWATQQSADNSRLFTILRREKLGLGSAVRDGLAWALDRSYAFVINMDADQSHNPSDAVTLLRGCIESQPPIDVAIGSRYILGGGAVGLSRRKRIASKLLNAYATRLLQLPVRDCSGSFRCYRSSALRQLDFSKFRCNGYGFLEEILCALHRQRSTLAEFPIVYEHRHSGRSKLTLSDTLGALSVIHRLAISR